MVTLSCLALAGCQIVPADGPLSRDIVEDAGLSAVDQHRTGAEVYELLDVDSQVARTITDYQASKFQRRFKVAASVKQPVIGIGDALKITIFEASSDGLFSTKDSKQTSLDVVVQTNGMAAIPYVGSIRLAGKTIEQIRQTILEALKNKAVEPDVLVNLISTASRNVTVTGAVGRSEVVTLGLNGERILDMIARAGGPVAQPYETYVSLIRGSVRGTALLKEIVENPGENVFVQPRDQVYVYRDPRTFTILGSVKASKRVEFGANDLNLLEAIALAGGADATTSDVKGYFVFRYEEPEVLLQLVGKQELDRLLRNGMRADKDGRYPVVYRFGMDKPDSLLVGQTFSIKNRDVVYASRHPSVDLAKFLSIIATPIGVAAAATTISANLKN